VRWRVLLAIALTAAFYTLALVTVAVLIAGPIAVWIITDHGNIWLTFAGPAAGIAILRSMVPTRDDFEAPGPELSRDRQPELHALVDEVAAASGHAGPDSVYLDLSVNAGVFEHRRERVLLLGLPLLATLDREELSAVVAHELGHYAGGDTRFEAWIWRSRASLMQTIFTLARSKSTVRRLAAVPFGGYAILFLRITNAVSRRAEFDADALSARVASAAAAGRALRRLAAIGPAFDTYVNEDLVPMLNAERVPPLAEGFVALAGHEELAPALDQFVSANVSELEPDPYESHPTLRQRLEALGEPAEQTMPPLPATPASALLHDLPALERDLLVRRLGPEIEAYESVGWEQAGDVHLAAERRLAEEHGSAIGSGASIGDAGQLASEFTGQPSDQLTRNAANTRAALRASLPPSIAHSLDGVIDRVAVLVLAAMVTAAAADSGALITAPPGEPIRIWARGRHVDPHRELESVASGDEPVDRWTELIAPTGLANVPLERSAQRSTDPATRAAPGST
jgi:heat shock protein HtpX